MAFVLHVLGLLAMLIVEGDCQCYSSNTQCSLQPDPAPTDVALEPCCRGNGVSFSDTDAETCILCTVFGWLNGSSLELSERQGSYLLQAGYEKGAEEAQLVTLSFTISVLSGSTANNNSDYMLSSRTIQFTPDSPGSVELTLTADGVASEAAEAVQLMLTPQQGTTVPDGLGTFSNTLLTVTIVDADTEPTSTSRPTTTPPITTDTDSTTMMVRGTTTKAPDTDADSTTMMVRGTTTKAPDTTKPANDSEEAGGRGLSAGQIGGLVAGLIAAVIVAILVATIIAYAAYYKKTHVTTV